MKRIKTRLRKRKESRSNNGPRSPSHLVSKGSMESELSVMTMSDTGDYLLEGREVDEQQQQESTSSSNDDQLVEVGHSLEQWASNAQALVHSREMNNFILSTQNVALDITCKAIDITGMALNIAFLPVTIPLHVAGSATNLVVGTCTAVASTSCAIVDATLFGGEEANPLDDFMHHVTHIVPTVFGVAEEVKNGIGGYLLGLVSPILGAQPQQQRRHLSENRDEDKQQALNRLRLDFDAGAKQLTTKGTLSSSVSNADYSKYLLRVEDLNVKTETGERLRFVDLSLKNDYATRSLDALLAHGLAMVGATSDNDTFTGTIDWKMEGSTQKILKKKTSLSDAEWTTIMQQEALVWSGKFSEGAHQDKDATVFLSRGIVPGSPRQVFDMLWDNSRTAEYNNYCAGRSDLLLLRDEFDPTHESRVMASKVVKSETRVPFTPNLSVGMTTLMIGIQVSDNLFAIVSRSLTAGGAGHHTTSGIDRDRNEIIWGVNLLRAVPTALGLTDLTGFSQVSSSMVPKFLTHKVGMMAVENCFSAFRSREIPQESSGTASLDMAKAVIV